jgi:hypothetical protein
MDDHQRIWSQMLDQLDKYIQRAASTLKGWSTISKDSSALRTFTASRRNAFWTQLAPIIGELELRTQDWAPPGASSDTALAAALTGYRAWTQNMLNNPDDKRL